jgi:hypothetical protein
VAVFGAIFSNRLFAELPKYLPASALAHLHGQSISLNPAQLDALPPPVHHGYVLAFSHSLVIVFLIGVPFAVAAFLLSWLLKEVPLRDHAFVTRSGTEEPAGPGRRPAQPMAGSTG